MMKNSIINLLRQYIINCDEIRSLIDLPKQYDRNAQKLKKGIDKFDLPLRVTFFKNQLKEAKDKEKIKQIEIIIEKLTKKLKEISPEQFDKKGELISIWLPIQEKDFKKHQKQVWEFKKFNSYRIHLGKWTLYNLISSFENSIGSLLHIIIWKHPEIIKLDEHKLSYEEIKEYWSIEDLESDLISMKVESLLFWSFWNIFTFLQKKVFKNHSQAICNSEVLIEAKERRNLLIHNNWYVNSRYVKNVTPELVKRYKIKKDHQVQVSHSYLNTVLDSYEIAWIYILFIAWVIFEKENRKDLIWILNGVIYDKIDWDKKNLYVAELLCQLAIENESKKYFDDLQKDYYLFNYWQILKIQKRSNEYEEAAKLFDISSKNNLIKLCYYAVLDDYEAASSFIIPALRAKEIDLEEYETFKILKWLRSSKLWKKTIKEYKNEKKD